MIFALLDILGVAFILWILYSQIVLPLRNGTPIFPVFNDDISDAQTEVEIAREDLEVARLEKEAEELRKKAALLKSQQKQ